MSEIAFREADSRVRNDYSPQDFTILRHLALNLLKQERTSNRSIKSKRLQTAWNTDYLEKVLAGLANLA